MVISSLLVVAQLVIIFAMLLVTLMAYRTSRRQRSRQKSYLAMALGLMMLSLLGLLWLVLATKPSRSIADMSYWLALSLPAVPLVLCLWTVRRVFDKGRRRRSGSTRNAEAQDSVF
jgi:cytochrome bd-type quinol oxidase subunit 2